VHANLELAHRLGLERIILVGASIGGWIAAEMATKAMRLVDRLVLIGPIGIKVGPIDRLDVPDIYAMPQSEVDRLFYARPEQWRLDPATKSDAELAIVAQNRETLALVTWEPFMHNPKLKHRELCAPHPRRAACDDRRRGTFSACRAAGRSGRERRALCR
jgi:pimeloyl-ACP methyl ester carboxylesterase